LTEGAQRYAILLAVLLSPLVCRMRLVLVTILLLLLLGAAPEALRGYLVFE
jgi:hypothetical protein